MYRVSTKQCLIIKLNNLETDIDKSKTSVMFAIEAVQIWYRGFKITCCRQMVLYADNCKSSINKDECVRESECSNVLLL